jgi:hypothetical protein
MLRELYLVTLAPRYASAPVHTVQQLYVLRMSRGTLGRLSSVDSRKAACQFAQGPDSWSALVCHQYYVRNGRAIPVTGRGGP